MAITGAKKTISITIMEVRSIYIEVVGETKLGLQRMTNYNHLNMVGWWATIE